MKLLTNFKNIEDQVGKIVVLNKSENSTLFVLWSVEDKVATIAELDRPQDGETLSIDPYKQSIYLLEPIEIIERVTEWI